jgi:flagellar protein FlaG
MDVQATSAAAALPPAFALVAPVPPGTNSSTPPAGSSPAFASITSVPAVSQTDSQSSGSGSSGNSSIGANPGLATLPAGPPDGTKKGAQTDPSLGSKVAQLFNAQEQNVSVSFQVEQNPNEIVTVFTDKQTGKVIVQFPSETLIALAKFFDKLDGVAVNKKA